MYWSFSSPVGKRLNSRSTVVPTKSDSDVIFCLQLPSKILTCSFYLRKGKSIDHLCINSRSTVVSTKSDSDAILCLQLLSKILTCTLYLS